MCGEERKSLVLVVDACLFVGSEDKKDGEHAYMFSVGSEESGEDAIEEISNVLDVSSHKAANKPKNHLVVPIPATAELLLVFVLEVV